MSAALAHLRRFLPSRRDYDGLREPPDALGDRRTIHRMPFLQMKKWAGAHS